MTGLRIFISHSWDDSENYHSLCELLSVVASPWENLSISRDNAVSIATGADADPQRQQLLLERLQAIADRVLAIDRECDTIRSTVASVCESINEMSIFESLTSHMEKAQEHILDVAYVSTIRRLERIRKRYTNVDVTSHLSEALQHKKTLNEKVQALLEERNRLLRETRQCQDSLSTMHIDLGATGKQRDHVIRRFPTLALAIRNRIALADAVLLIVYPFSSYRAWLEFEYQEAFVLGKPIFGLLREDLCRALPPDLARFGITPVIWTSEELLAILQNVCQGNREPPHFGPV